MTKGDKVSSKLETLHLKVFIHCEGCRRKIKKLLYSVDGVEAITIDSETGKASVTGTADAKSLLQRLAKANKQAELWPGSNNGGEKGAVLDSQAKPKGNNADKDDKKKDKDDKKKEQVKERASPEGADKLKEEAIKESKAKGSAGSNGGNNSKGGNTKEGADKSKEEASKEGKAKGSAGSNGGNNSKGGNAKKDGGGSADNAGKKGGNKKPSPSDSKRVTFEGDGNGEGKKGSTTEGLNAPNGEAPWKGSSQEEWQEGTPAEDNSGQAKRSPNDGKKNNAKVKKDEGDNNAVIEIAAGDRSQPLSHRTMAPLDSTQTSYSLQSAEYATHMFSDENANNCRIM